MSNNGKWNPDNDEQNAQLREFACRKARELGIRDWDDCLQEALGYALYGRKIKGKWASRRNGTPSHTIYYIRNLITNRLLDGLEAQQRRDDRLIEIPGLLK